MPLAVEAQEVFTIATFEGLFTPTCVPQGVLNATAYFQGVMTELSVGLNYKIWVDDIVWWRADEDGLPLDKIPGRLGDAGLFVTLLTSLFSDTEILWCRKVYSGGQVSHDRECLSGLASIRGQPLANIAPLLQNYLSPTHNSMLFPRSPDLTRLAWSHVEFPPCAPPAELEGA